MRYDEKTGIIDISAEEFISISRRRVSRTHSPDGEEFSAAKSATSRAILNGEEVLEAEIITELYGIKTRIYAALYKVKEEICAVRELQGKRGKIPDYVIKQTRGELFLKALMYCRQNRLSECKICAYYCDTGTGCIDKRSEIASLSALENFFEKCKATVSLFARPEVERVTLRHKTMRELKFPYREVRDGQGELVRAVYRNIARGTNLFCEAPTGTGKTVSAIYPALKAMGDGRVEKVFYLTPKTTARQAAIDCINLLNEYGLKIKAVSLIAKEKICRHDLICREGANLCPTNNEGKLCDAALALYNMDKAVIGSEEILATAQSFGVCSYELSLTYSELCDFVICDLNYVFDTSVYLRRYFDKGGNYALLIDEAHNLEGRAREMYSAEISTNGLLEYANADELCGTALAGMLIAAANNLSTLFYPYLKDSIRKDENGEEISFTHLSEIPSDMYTIVYNLEHTLSEELIKAYTYTCADKAARVQKIKKLYYDIVKLNYVLGCFDNSYKLLLSLNGGGITARAFCIDTGNVLKARLKKVSSAIFFSATLEPMSYYTAVLGSGRDCDTISVRSPFDKDNLSVSIMDKISTRYSERERTAPAICRVIAATMSARRGHYMVFCPSFEYSEMLYREFTAKYPKIDCLIQKQNMTDRERALFIDKFKENAGTYLLGFCVMGGIYSEGIDLAGDSLIGAIVVGIGIPSLSYEREAIAEYYENKLEAGKQFAYIYPGMNRVFQAAGRVIRREDDRGVIVLIDDRFCDPIYKKSIPELWRGMRYLDDAKALRENLDAFWQGVDKEKAKKSDTGTVKQ